jgi:coatomer subunit beta
VVDLNESLKVIEKPIPLTLRAESSAMVKASLKVSSTDSGLIYGYLSYDSPTGNDPELLNINEI